MTKRKRAQVVELLRCAADLWVCGEGGIGNAAFHLDSHMVWLSAVSSWDRAAESMCIWADVTYGDVCLEAAANVEDGSWF
jgi:hypothetical protein